MTCSNPIDAAVLADYCSPRRQVLSRKKRLRCICSPVTDAGRGSAK